MKWSEQESGQTYVNCKWRDSQFIYILKTKTKHVTADKMLFIVITNEHTENYQYSQLHVLDACSSLKSKSQPFAYSYMYKKWQKQRKKLSKQQSTIIFIFYSTLAAILK